MTVNTSDDFRYRAFSIEPEIDFEKMERYSSESRLSIDLLIEQGEAAFRVEDFTTAYSSFMQADRLDSSDIRIQAGLKKVNEKYGEKAFQAGNFLKALNYYVQAGSQNDTNRIISAIIKRAEAFELDADGFFKEASLDATNEAHAGYKKIVLDFSTVGRLAPSKYTEYQLAEKIDRIQKKIEKARERLQFAEADMILSKARQSFKILRKKYEESKKQKHQLESFRRELNDVIYRFGSARKLIGDGSMPDFIEIKEFLKEIEDQIHKSDLEVSLTRMFDCISSLKVLSLEQEEDLFLIAKYCTIWRELHSQVVCSPFVKAISLARVKVIIDDIFRSVQFSQYLLANRNNLFVMIIEQAMQANRSKRALSNDAKTLLVNNATQIFKDAEMRKRLFCLREDDYQELKGFVSVYFEKKITKNQLSCLLWGNSKFNFQKNAEISKDELKAWMIQIKNSKVAEVSLIALLKPIPSSDFAVLNAVSEVNGKSQQEPKDHLEPRNRR